MRQIVIPRAGGPEVLQLREKEDPEPKGGEVAIRVKAAGINFADILARKGLYPDAPPMPCVVGYEVSGIVERVGEGVDPALSGTPVVAITRFGGYADLVVVPERQVFPKPEALSFEAAAALPVNYLTAYQAIVVMGGLRKGETILIHNAGGGVGIAALDLARKIGARTLGTASSAKHAFLEARGLDHAIDYRNQDWTKEVARLTDERGVELILDPLGGANWRKSYRALRATGRLAMFGISSVTESGFGRGFRFLKIALQTPFFHPFLLMNRNRGVFGVNLGHLWHEPEKIRQWMAEILTEVEQGRLRPHIDQVFPFSEAAAAHRYIEERRNTGKVLLVPA